MNFDMLITIYPTLSKKLFLLNPLFFLSDETVIIHLQTKTLLHVRTSKSSRRHPVSTRSICQSPIPTKSA